MDRGLIMNNLDFLNLNSLRNYPIKDDLSRVSNDGLLTIPNTLIVDLVLSSPSNDLLTLYISRVSYNSSNLLIEISANTIGVFGTFQTSLPLVDDNIDIVMTAGSLFPLATGIITIGSTDDLANLPVGDFEFGLTNTALLMRVYGPGSQGINYLSFTDTKGNNSVLTGYIQLIGNSNIQFRGTGGSIYIDAGENLGLNKDCASANVPITSINGIPADASGNFTLIPQACVGIDIAQAGLVISDSCGQPCLGCSEINTLTTQVNGLESSIIDIKAFAQNLQAAINQATTLLNYQC